MSDRLDDTGVYLTHLDFKASLERHNSGSEDLSHITSIRVQCGATAQNPLLDDAVLPPLPVMPNLAKLSFEFYPKSGTAVSIFTIPRVMDWASRCPNMTELVLIAIVDDAVDNWDAPIDLPSLELLRIDRYELTAAKERRFWGLMRGTVKRMMFECLVPVTSDGGAAYTGFSEANIGVRELGLRLRDMEEIRPLPSRTVVMLEALVGGPAFMMDDPYPLLTSLCYDWSGGINTLRILWWNITNDRLPALVHVRLALYGDFDITATPYIIMMGKLSEESAGRGFALEIQPTNYVP